MTEVCEECGENATVPGELARRCAECLDDLFDTDGPEPPADVDTVLDALRRVRDVRDAGVYDGDLEVTLAADAPGVPFLVPVYLAEGGYEITDVSPQGSPAHLIVRAE